VTSLPNSLSTLQVGTQTARGRTSVAACPVLGVDLPETDIVAASSVLVEGIDVTAAFMLNNALAALLKIKRLVNFTLQKD